MNNDRQFPTNFFWGASTSAHQVEGANHNDWTEWEKLNADRLAAEAPAKFANVVPDWERIKPEATDPDNYISGMAADHYHKFKEDIAIMKQLNLNAFRFGIEWSRVQPQEKVWDEQEIAHYREVIKELRSHNIEPFVTLWHRTLPLWVARQHEWENKKTVKDFLYFVKKIAGEFGSDVKYWMTLNEPIMHLGGGYFSKEYPPQRNNIFAAYKAYQNLVTAHNEASQLIRETVNSAQVGICQAISWNEPYKNKFLNRLITQLANYFNNWKFLNDTYKLCDFIGVQYYSRALLNVKLGGEYKFAERIIEREKTDMGWEIYPEGIYKVVMEINKRYNKPIIITENGIADALDAKREKFIIDHLTDLQRAIQEGADVRGYLHWSLLDNLEWNKGFWPKFGLVSVNRSSGNFERTVRQSALTYAKIAKDNAI